MRERIIEANADDPPTTPRLKLSRFEMEAQAAALRSPQAPGLAEVGRSEQKNSEGYTELSYTGTAFGYAKVWLVNILAIVLSLGILSPWALSRSRRYFFSHTEIDGENFAFSPRPGSACARIAVMYLFILAGIGSIVWQPFSYWAWTAMGLFALALGLVPGLVHATVKSNFDAISYRSVKVTFVGDGWSAFVNYFLLPALVIVASWSLYIFSYRGMSVAVGFFQTSLFVYLHQSFKFKNLEFGRRRIRYNGRFKEFRSIYTIPCMVWVVYHAMIFAIGYTLFRFGIVSESDLELLTTDNSAGPLPGGPTLYAVVGGLILIELLWSWWAEIYIKVRARSYFFDQLEIDGAKVIDAYTTWSYMRLSLSNMLIVIASVGLLAPWAALRYHRYLVSRLAIIGNPEAIRRLCSKAGPRGEDGFLRN